MQVSYLRTPVLSWKEKDWKGGKPVSASVFMLVLKPDCQQLVTKMFSTVPYFMLASSSVALATVWECSSWFVLLLS